MIKPITKKVFESEDFKKSCLVAERARLIAEINGHLSRVIPGLDFEVWGYSKREVIDNVLSEYIESGWKIESHVWHSFSWRANIKFIK